MAGKSHYRIVASPGRRTWRAIQLTEDRRRVFSCQQAL